MEFFGGESGLNDSCFMTTSWRCRSASGILACICLVSFVRAPALSQEQRPEPLPAPGQGADVICASDAAQSYALYLPVAYSAAKQWPIIYFFDPGGRGRFPLDLYKKVAESYGFILAGSNNSRNFSNEPAKAVNAIWQDTHVRLAIDERRSYASGFSGGARMAGAMAISGPAGQIAGVIANGAGYPNDSAGSRQQLLYFLAVGDQDFNWPEVVDIRREREERGLPYRVRVFSGGHQWAPPEVLEDAIQYLNLKAMQAGKLARDEAFVDRVHAKIKGEADDAEKKQDSIALLSAYRALVSDFSGLREVKEFSAKLSVLQQSPALKAALKKEHEQIAGQYKLESEISPKIRTYAAGSVPDANALGLEIRQQLGGLRDQGSRDKNEAKRLICKRAFTGVWVRAMEDGQQELEARHFDKAEAYFDLLRQVSDDAWPVLLLADTHAAAGNKKLAIRDLQEAVRRGLHDAAAIESDPRLQSLKTEPEFQKVVAGLKEK